MKFDFKSNFSFTLSKISISSNKNYIPTYIVKAYKHKTHLQYSNIVISIFKFVNSSGLNSIELIYFIYCIMLKTLLSTGICQSYWWYEKKA